VLALGLALHEQGKHVQMVLDNGFSSEFRHLEGSQLIIKKGEAPVDLVVALDAADFHRIGDSTKDFPQVHVNIDHHITNTNYAEINLVDPVSVATCALLAEYFPDLGLEFSAPVVDALLTGLLTDTLGLRTSNMNAKALRIAAELVERGADLPYLYERALLNRSFEAMRYWGAGLSQLQRDGDMVWALLSLEDRKAVGYPGSDDAELVNALSAIDSAAITVLFIEQPNNQVKVSWRSRGEYDVAMIASQFGGGGHVAAAGATISGSLQEVQERVLEATQAVLARVSA
jgi:phosphoesterase RecJ-like protein